MQWNRGIIEAIRSDIQELKAGQNRLLDHLMGIHRDMSGFHGEMAGLHRDISGLHKEISGLHKEMSEMHGEYSRIHMSIAVQTRWILTALLGAATLISLGLPVALQLARRYL